MKEGWNKFHITSTDDRIESARKPPAYPRAKGNKDFDKTISIENNISAMLLDENPVPEEEIWNLLGGNSFAARRIFNRIKGNIENMEEGAKVMKTTIQEENDDQTISETPGFQLVYVNEDELEVE